MKLTTTNVMVTMVALVAISAGTTFAFTQGLVDNSTFQPGAALLAGNVKVTQYDGDGNIIAYRQSSNHITAQGMELIMLNVFSDINATAQSAPWDTIPSGADGKVRWMEIGTAGEWELLFNDTNLRDPVFDTSPACIRQDSAIANVSSHKYPIDPALCFVTPAARAGAASTCFARMNVTAMASFSGMQCSGALDIDEAGIFNDPTSNTGEMFARNTFGGVVLNPPDTLALDWEFTFSDS